VVDRFPDTELSGPAALAVRRTAASVARVMRLLAARMTDEEIKAVAEYIAGL